MIRPCLAPKLPKAVRSAISATAALLVKM